MSRIVVCGDSFNTYDTRYPGLHWADQLAPHEVYRLARVGASNFSIWHQVVQSKKFDPDVVLISLPTNLPNFFPPGEECKGTKWKVELIPFT